MFVLTSMTGTAQVESEWTEVVISGYANKEFAVKGDVQIQAENLIKKIRSEWQNPAMGLQIVTYGSADKTGLSDENDDYSQKRAEAMANFLGAELSSTNMKFVPTGDQDDKRQVRVRYRFFLSEAADSVEDNNQLNAILIFSIFAFVILIFFAFIFNKAFRKNVGIEQSQIPSSTSNSVISDSVKGDRYERMDVEADGRVYDVLVKRAFRNKNGSRVRREAYLSPFCNNEESPFGEVGKEIVEFTPLAIKGSMARMLKNHPEKILKLIETIVNGEKIIIIK